MSSSRLPGVAGGDQAEPYRSIECRAGTHVCGEGEPRKRSDGLPLIYELCLCACHKPTTSNHTTQSSRGTD